MRLADEAQTLAKIVLEAGGTLEEVLGQATIEEAAAARQIDPDDLREAIEGELTRARRPR
jgi:hypothetical protein